MTDQDPGSWVGRLFGWSLLLLVAAMALDGAVRILAGIWPVLTIVCGSMRLALRRSEVLPRGAES